MGKRTVTSAKRRRLTKRKSRRAGQTLPAVGVVLLRLLRNFTLYPKQLSSDTPANNFWLDKFVQYGAIAMKIFLAAVSYSNRIGATLAPYASVQCIAFGPEDLLWSSAIKEVRRIDVVDQGAVKHLACPCIDYRQARIRSLTVRITPSSDMAKRGGRIVIAIVPLSLAEAYSLTMGTLPVQQLDFALLLQMPGATVSAANRTVTKTWKPKPSDMGHEFREIGSPVTPTAKVPTPAGGMATALVYLGYQDMAGSKPDPTTLYSPEEATFNVDVSGMVDLREYGTSYIRKSPKVVFSSDTVGVIHPDCLVPTNHSLADLEISSQAIVLPDRLVSDEMRSAFSSQCTSVSSDFSHLRVETPDPKP